MRKVIVLLLIALCAFSATAQNYYTSLLNGRTYGLLDNELDQAFTVSEDFGSLSQTYLLFGLNNDGLVQVDGSEGNFSMGFYLPGTNAMANFTRLNLSSSLTGGNSLVETPATDVAGDLYLASSVLTEDKYPIVQSLNLSNTFIYKMDGMVLGVYAAYVFANNDGVINDSVTTSTFNYLTGTTASTLKEDYVSTVTDITDNNSTTLMVAVPMSLELFGANHVIIPGITLNHENDSITKTTVYGKGRNSIAAGNYGLTNDQIQTNIDNIITLSFSDKFKFGNFVEGDARNGFYLDSDLSLTLHLFMFNNVTEAYTPTWTTAGGSLTNVGLVRNETESSYDLFEGFSLGTTASQDMYFNLGSDAELATSLSAGLKYTADRNTAASSPIINKTIATTSTDGDSDGKFTSAADTISTVTTTYKSQNINGSGTISLSTAVASAVKFQPNGLPVGLTLAANPQVDFNIVMTTDHTQSTDVHTLNKNGAGVTTGETTTTGYDYNSVTSVSYTAAASTPHAISLFYVFSDNATAYFTINNSSLLSFETFSVELVIGF